MVGLREDELIESFDKPSDELAPALRVWHEAILEFLAATAVPAASQCTPDHSEMAGYPAQLS
jgi:hypothetical protein